MMIKRCVALLIIISLISILPISIISLSSYRDDDLGVFFDSLDNDSYIDKTRSEGYKIENGYATIDLDEVSHIYNCMISPDKIEIFYRNDSQQYFLLNTLIRPDIFMILEENLSDPSILESVDGVYFKTESSNLSLIVSRKIVPLQHYRFRIDQDPENITSITLTWYGSSNGEYIRVFAWDYYALSSIGMWRHQRDIYDSPDSFAIGYTDTWKNDLNPSRFISREGYIDVVLTPWPAGKEATYLYTDYISLEVRESTRNNATIVTKPISPSKIWRWEYLEWEENVSKGTSIKAQILDKDGNLLSDELLEGNSGGFGGGKVPLYKIAGEESIRIKFSLETVHPMFNPKLLSYLVLWQTDSMKWRDDLSTDYRLENKTNKRIISKTIHLPTGYWWKEFHAELNLSGGGSVTFSILSKDGKVIIDKITGRSSTTYNISNICEKAIKLRADIESNGSFVPKIKNWTVTFSRETGEPVLKYPPIVYINREDLKRKKIDIIISAKDDFPGIDKDSAKYMLEYIDNITRYRYSSIWIPGDVSGEYCSKKWVNVSARSIPIFYDDSLKDLLNLKDKRNITLYRIWFKVSDVAGNSKMSGEIRIEIDVNPPKSRILTDVDRLGFKHSYGEEIEISAYATDDISNVKDVTLYYYTSSSPEPRKYSTIKDQPWTWTIKTDDIAASRSDYYSFFTIATDNAGNVEEKEKGELTILIDIGRPDKPKFEDKIHWLNSPRIGFVEFSDDLCIDSIEYRIGGEEYFEWNEIARNVNSSRYSEDWMISTWDWEQMDSGRVYSVYFRVKDLVGNEYVTQNEGDALRIAKDILPPYPSIESINLWQSRVPVEIFSFASDQNGSGISKVILLYRYSTDKETWSEWKEYNETTFSGWHTWLFDPDERDGYYEIRLRAYDFAGNFLDSRIIDFGLTIFPRNEMISLVVSFLVFIGVSAFTIRKWS